MKSNAEKKPQEPVHYLINYLQSVFSIITGRHLSFKKLKREDVKEFGLILTEGLELTQRIEEIDSLKLSEKKKIQLAYESVYPRMSALVRKAFPEIPQEQDFTEWIIKKAENELPQPPAWSFVKTDYFSYINSIEELMRVVHDDYPEFFAAFFQSYFGDADFLIAARLMVSRLDKHYKYLDKERKKTTKHIEKLIQIYTDLSGEFEKYLNLIYALVIILDNKNRVEYSRVKNVPTSKKLEYRKSRSKKPHGPLQLVQPFNKEIRNSIAYKSYLPNPTTKKIGFAHFNKATVLTYDDFEDEARNLATLVLALSRFPTIEKKLEMGDFHYIFQEYRKSAREKR